MVSNMLHGVQLIVSSFEQGLWFDDDERHRDFSGWGLKLAFYWGPVTLSMPAYWKYSWHEVWACLLNNVANPLPESLSITLPFGFGPFISICYKRIGFYFGLKAHKDYELIPTMRFTIHRRF